MSTYLACILLGVAIMLIASICVLRALLRVRKSLRQTMCVRCQYPLQANHSKCSECGFEGGSCPTIMSTLRYVYKTRALIGFTSCMTGSILITVGVSLTDWFRDYVPSSAYVQYSRFVKLLSSEQWKQCLQDQQVSSLSSADRFELAADVANEASEASTASQQADLLEFIDNIVVPSSAHLVIESDHRLPLRDREMQILVIQRLVSVLRVHRSPADPSTINALCAVLELHPELRVVLAAVVGRSPASNRVGRGASDLNDVRLSELLAGRRFRQPSTVAIQDITKALLLIETEDQDDLAQHLLNSLKDVPGIDPSWGSILYIISDALAGTRNEKVSVEIIRRYLLDPSRSRVASSFISYHYEYGDGDNERMQSMAEQVMDRYPAFRGLSSHR